MQKRSNAASLSAVRSDQRFQYRTTRPSGIMCCTKTNTRDIYHGNAKRSKAKQIIPSFFPSTNGNSTKEKRDSKTEQPKNKAAPEKPKPNPVVQVSFRKYSFFGGRGKSKRGNKLLFGFVLVFSLFLFPNSSPLTRNSIEPRSLTPLQASCCSRFLSFRLGLIPFDWMMGRTRMPRLLLRFVSYRFVSCFLDLSSACLYSIELRLFVSLPF